MQVQPEPANQAAVIALIAELDANQDTLYPPQRATRWTCRRWGGRTVLLVVARDHDGTGMACGAVVLGPEAGELKRMFVRTAYPAQGVAAQVLANA
jgi:putative acetyltransferase